MRISILALLFAVGSATHGAAQVFGSEYDGKQAPIRDGEQPVIPLATEDPTYNVWRTPLESFEGLREGREPGIVQTQRFLNMVGG